VKDIHTAVDNFQVKLNRGQRELNHLHRVRSRILLALIAFLPACGHELTSFEEAHQSKATDRPAAALAKPGIRSSAGGARLFVWWMFQNRRASKQPANRISEFGPWATCRRKRFARFTGRVGFLKMQAAEKARQARKPKTSLQAAPARRPRRHGRKTAGSRKGGSAVGDSAPMCCMNHLAMHIGGHGDAVKRQTVSNKLWLSPRHRLQNHQQAHSKTLESTQRPSSRRSGTRGR